MTLEEKGLLQEMIKRLLDDRFQLEGGLRTRVPEPEDVDGLLSRADLIIVAGDSSYVVEVKQRLTMDDVARALLVKRMMGGEGSDYPNLEPVLIAKNVPKKVQEVADEVGVHVIRLGSDVQLPFEVSSRPSRVSKVSHWKSWKVTTELMRSGPTSIRQLAIATEVSYGWAHATVRHLVEMGVATRSDDGVRITDMERLLDGVAWERPLSNLLVRQFGVAGDDYMEVARDIEDALVEWKHEHAFTGFTAGGIYTGYGQRFDSIYLYLDTLAMDEVEASLGGGGDITLRLYASDRNVWDEVRVVEGLSMASPSQTLLDLIGLGYGARTMAREMWKYHETTTYR
jgi:DNA-binding Lrp family transcriptional regulator